MRALRFATQVGAAASGPAWIALARKLERLGYGTLSMPDHVAGRAWSPFPALGAAAAATTRLRLGTLVLDNDFRNPLLLARESATLDVVSGGRFELGLGAGWYLRDYESLGIPFDRGTVRVGRLAEALVVLKRLFAEDEVTFEGTYYRMQAASCEPRPVQRLGPPLLVAGGGPKILQLAGAHADIVALVPMVGPEGQIRGEELSFAANAAKVERIRRAAGERFGEIELSIFLDVVLTDDRERSVREIAKRAKLPEGAIGASLFRPIGTIEDVRRHILRARDELAISYFCIRGSHVDELGPLVRQLTGA